MRATHKIEFLPQLQLSTSLVLPDWFKYFIIAVLSFIMVLSFFGTVYVRYSNMNLQLNITKAVSEYSDLIKHNQYLKSTLYNLNQYERVYDMAHIQKMRLPEVPEPFIVN
ncbi:MAG TPA: hypothetical protein QF353_06080 [Gammaproteobacteria bacterium]|nr:hypothetical protein [Gammaproteobacteria bacterium]